MTLPELPIIITPEQQENKFIAPRLAAEAFRAGMSLADFVASKPTAPFDAQWGDATLFLPLVYKGGFAHLRELGGVI